MEYVDAQAALDMTRIQTYNWSWGVSKAPHWPAGVHASADGTEVATPVSLMEWFLNFYEASHRGPVKPVEGIVRAGEVLFVPRGWWHLAMNLEVLLRLSLAMPVLTQL